MYCFLPSLKRNSSCVGWCKSIIPALRRLRQRGYLDIPISLCYLGDSCLRKGGGEKEGEGGREEERNLELGRWLVQAQQCMAVIPGEQETGGFLRLASKLVWPNQWTLDSVRDLFKIRQRGRHLMLPPPGACACVRTHRANERLQAFLSWAWVCVCMWCVMSGCGSTCVPGFFEEIIEYHVGSMFSFHLFCGLWGSNTGQQASSFNQWALASTHYRRFV